MWKTREQETKTERAIVARCMVVAFAVAALSVSLIYGLA
jgi:hypothetical protein